MPTHGMLPLQQPGFTRVRRSLTWQGRVAEKSGERAGRTRPGLRSSASAAGARTTLGCTATTTRPLPSLRARRSRVYTQ